MKSTFGYTTVRLKGNEMIVYLSRKDRYVRINFKYPLEYKM